MDRCINNLLLTAIACLCISVQSCLKADDIEIYQRHHTAASGKAKVLIIVDNSSSMSISAGLGNNTTNVVNSPSRMQIIKSLLTQIVSNNPSIDFGIMTFNNNANGVSHHGGRVINHMMSSNTLAQQNNLLNSINNLNANSWTPLCETTYEAYRMLSGASVHYGLQQALTDVPSRDLSAETVSGYISPISNCGYTYIILLTDSEPSFDTDANSAIESLTNKTCSQYKNHQGLLKKNCLPELAEYMANTDLDNNAGNGNQYAFTYTIGFTTQQTLLADTASRGKGQYYTASTVSSLKAAFQSTLNSILSSNATFTAPALAIDSFNKTESLNEAYFAMFKPTDGLNWPGNIKKLNLSISAGNAILTDTTGVAAIDSATGNIAKTAQTLWSTTVDGDDVLKGGVGALLASRNPSSRVILSNTGSNDSLENFNAANMTASAFQNIADQTSLFKYFGVTDQQSLNATIDWARGIDVDDKDNDGSVTDPQPWIVADILHSRPLVVNYGALGLATKSTPEQRLVVGTNGGFLHMFGVNDGHEDWAFFAKELAPILNRRRMDNVSSSHAYGIDAPLTAYTDDGGDGTIDSTKGDKAYVYFGLRRGGRILYALDISNPDSPTFLWKIDHHTAGFSELGQTWSVPVITNIPGYTYDHDNDGNSVSATPQIPKPVLVFGAGYDTNKDAHTLATIDSMGRGIFIVDAFSGTLIWSYTKLKHSVAADVTLFDSNGDGLSDRIYFADTGGNLWRVDLTGSVRTSWRVTHLASFNQGTPATDRRFFNAPDVVRTRRQICTQYDPLSSNNNCKAVATINFDSVIIGSGDRTNPNATDVNNQFYMIKDVQTSPYQTVAPIKPCNHDFRCKLPLTGKDLFDVTSNELQIGNNAQKVIAATTLQKSQGWRLDLSVKGEKSLSRATTLNGSIYFTTFSPTVQLQQSCLSLTGNARLYQVDLQDATAKGINSQVDSRSIDVGNLIPDSIKLHFHSDKKIRLILPPGSSLKKKNLIDTGAIIPAPYPVYWYQKESL